MFEILCVFFHSWEIAQFLKSRKQTVEQLGKFIYPFGRNVCKNECENENNTRPVQTFLQDQIQRLSLFQ